MSIKMDNYLMLKKSLQLIWQWAMVLTAKGILLCIVSVAQAYDITLGWDPSSEPNLAGFAVYASSSVSGPPYDLIDNYPIEDIDPANPKVKITGLDNQVPYYFAVTAYDTGGHESVYSGEICVINGRGCSASVKEPVEEPVVDPIRDFVTRFYQQCLNRQPEPHGLEFWSDGLLIKNFTGADVASGFIHSTEYIERDTSNEEYLRILYLAFFNRDPDPTGWDAWMAELKAGKDRDLVLNGFLHSQEFSELCEAYGIIPH